MATQKTPSDTPLRSDKPLRKDAAENRQRILDAAAQVFFASGLDAAVEEVARVAGVGVGTLYRRFPSKQALIDELVGEMRLVLAAAAREATGREDGSGLEALVLETGKLQSVQWACLPQLWDHSNAEPDALEEFRTRTAELLASAQQCGRIRSDITPTDISMLFWALRGISETSHSVAPDAWRRHLEIVFAGMRPVVDGPFAAPLQVKALSAAQVRKINR